MYCRIGSRELMTYMDYDKDVSRDVRVKRLITDQPVGYTCIIPLSD